MLKLTFNLFLITISVIVLLSLSNGRALAAIDCNNPATTADAIKCGSNDAAGQTGNAKPSNLNNTIQSIVNILTAIVGIAAVVMIIIGGLRYITSGGATDKVASAKNTLIYAVIGLVVVALAQVIVHFVIQKFK